jgi:hypothetical protein
VPIWAKENPGRESRGAKRPPEGAGGLPVDLNVSLGEGSRTSRGPRARDHDHERIVRSRLPIVLDLHRELRYSRAHVSVPVYVTSFGPVCVNESIESETR